jgi:hypothetical protein
MRYRCHPSNCNLTIRVTTHPPRRFAATQSDGPRATPSGTSEQMSSVSVRRRVFEALLKRLRMLAEAQGRDRV